MSQNIHSTSVLYPRVGSFHMTVTGKPAGADWKSPL